MPTKAKLFKTLNMFLLAEITMCNFVTVQFGKGFYFLHCLHSKNYPSVFLLLSPICTLQQHCSGKKH